jgi:predicted transcriptional regulator
MDHVAFMNKKWKMIEKILNGQKTIESRWYLKKRCPVDCIKKNDNIYFKNSGEKIVAKAKVDKIITYNDLTPKVVKEVLDQYSKEIGIEKSETEEYFDLFKNKKYCILIYLKNVEKITYPFDINKSKAGYCDRAAWVTTDNIEKIKIN